MLRLFQPVPGRLFEGLTRKNAAGEEGAEDRHREEKKPGTVVERAAKHKGNHRSWREGEKRKGTVA